MFLSDSLKGGTTPVQKIWKATEIPTFRVKPTIPVPHDHSSRDLLLGITLTTSMDVAGTITIYIPGYLSDYTGCSSTADTVMWCHPSGLAQGLICIQSSANISVQVYSQPPAISVINLCVNLLLAWLPPFQ